MSIVKPETWADGADSKEKYCLSSSSKPHLNTSRMTSEWKSSYSSLYKVIVNEHKRNETSTPIMDRGNSWVSSSAESRSGKETYSSQFTGMWSQVGYLHPSDSITIDNKRHNYSNRPFFILYMVKEQSTSTTGKVTHNDLKTLVSVLSMYTRKIQESFFLTFKSYARITKEILGLSSPNIPVSR